jgi:hypothetical protein
VVGSALAALILGVLAAPGAAMTTFAGSCSWNGISEIYPKAQIVPVPSGYKTSGQGNCKGTLDDAPFDGPVKIDVYADMHTPMSCAGGYSTQGGPFYITFITGPARPQPPPAGENRSTSTHAARKTHRRHHRRVRTRRAGAHAAANGPGLGEPPTAPQSAENPVLATWTDEAHVFPGEVVVDYWGAYRGLAVGHNRFESDENGLRQCFGEGLPTTRVVGTFSTIEELRG